MELKILEGLQVATLQFVLILLQYKFVANDGNWEWISVTYAWTIFHKVKTGKPITKRGVKKSINLHHFGLLLNVCKEHLSICLHESGST